MPYTVVGTREEINRVIIRQKWLKSLWKVANILLHCWTARNWLPNEKKTKSTNNVTIRRHYFLRYVLSSVYRPQQSNWPKTASRDISRHALSTWFSSHSILHLSLHPKNCSTQSFDTPLTILTWTDTTALIIPAHPNLKFFISHGGQLSTTEAIHFGVPVIGIPIAGDQHVNMRSVANKGFGITINLAEDMADEVYEAIQKMLGSTTWVTYSIETAVLYLLHLLCLIPSRAFLNPQKLRGLLFTSSLSLRNYRLIPTN